MRKYFEIILAIIFLFPIATYANSGTRVILYDWYEHTKKTPPVIDKSGGVYIGQYIDNEYGCDIKFVTGKTAGSGSVESDWSSSSDLSFMSGDGFISVDLWVLNPADICDVNGNRVFEVSLGSSNAENAVWGIGADLLRPMAQNRLFLHVLNGKAVLAGSTVNGWPVLFSKHSYAAGGNVDWKQVNYSKFDFAINGRAIEGNVGNLGAEMVDPLKVPYTMLPLTMVDPNPHLEEAKKSVVSIGKWSPYDILPPDIRKDAFFTNDLLKWESKAGWKAAFIGCKEGNFCLSMDQSVRGVPNAKLEFSADSPLSRVILVPDRPIKITKSFDTIDFWVYGKYHQGTDLTLSFRTKNGDIFRVHSGTQTYLSPGRLFAAWQLAHFTLAKKLVGAELMAIEVEPDKAGEFLFHFDQMRVIDYKKYLAKTPAPKYKKSGKSFVLPVRKEGALPTLDEKVKTSVSLIGDKSIFTYVSASGEKVVYTCDPKTGTMSDISVEVNGKTSFKPAYMSGPVILLDGHRFDTTTGECNVKLLSAAKKSDYVLYKYLFACGNKGILINYYLSISGKTLVVSASSDKGAVSSWEFGKAKGVENAKVLDVPCLGGLQKILLNDGMFVSYFPDWYKSNVSAFPIRNIMESWVNGDEAGYSFAPNNYLYLPLTDGKRHPLKEKLYITVSSRVEECFPTPANPPSPYKDILKKRLYKMIGPPVVEGGNWMSASNNLIDLYEHYGMSDMYVMFHAAIWSYRAGKGNEPFAYRMNTSASVPGGDDAVIKLFRKMSDLGFYPGYYGSIECYQPISSIWKYNNVNWLSDGRWRANWVQCLPPKTGFYANSGELYRKQVNKFGAKVIYEDCWTNMPLCFWNDYDQRMKQGRYIDSVRDIAVGFNEEREAVRGPVFSEGTDAIYQTAGLCDGDYLRLRNLWDGKSPDESKPEFFPDFQLRKVAPLCAPMSVDLDYWGFDSKAANYRTHPYFYHFLAIQIAYGTIGNMEPNYFLYSDANKYFDKMISGYFLLRALQERYIMEELLDILYWDVDRYNSPSDHLRAGKSAENMLRIRYKNGLTIYINGNWEDKNWTVDENGKNYILPPGGWMAEQGTDFLEFSALIDGNRVDFVDSPLYTYLDGHGTMVTMGGLTTDRVMVKHKSGKYKMKTLEYPEKN